MREQKQKQKQKPAIPVLVLIAGGIVLFVVAALLLTQNGNVATSTQTPAVAAGRENTYPGVARVSLADARVAFDSGSAIFVDVRSAETYAASHVAGALSIPSTELEARLGELSPDRWIITYCT